MVLKTFNVNEKTYIKFKELCQEQGMSMSKQIEQFMAYVIEVEPKAKKDYVKKLNKIRKGNFVQVKSFSQRYDL